MKKMIKIAFVAAFAAIAGYGVYANQKSEVLSDLTLANVEALAGSGETTIECCLALWGTPDFITFLRHHIAHNDNQRVT